MLGVIYEDGGEQRIVRPDFVFFVQQDDGTVAADIVDPHGIRFGDAMPKLKGLAQYAERFGDQYRRIEAVAKISDKFRVLDLKEAATRVSVSKATTSKVLYESADAFDFCPEDRRSWTPNPCAMDTALQRLRVSGNPKPFEIRGLIGLTGSGAVNRSGEYRLGENACAPFGA